MLFNYFIVTHPTNVPKLILFKSQSVRLIIILTIIIIIKTIIIIIMQSLVKKFLANSPQQAKV